MSEPIFFFFLFFALGSTWKASKIDQSIAIDGLATTALDGILAYQGVIQSHCHFYFTRLIESAQQVQLKNKNTDRFRRTFVTNLAIDAIRICCGL